MVGDDGGTTPLDVPLVLRVSELIGNDFDVDVGPAGAGIAFVGIDAVSIGTFEIVETAGDRFVALETPLGFTGELTITYRIRDAEGVEDTGFVTAAVANAYSGVLTGDARGELLVGALIGETIRGLGGDDLIRARDGNDTIEGGAGNDTIDAGAGDDLILGGPGADTIDGGAGFDTVDFAESNTGVRADLASRVGQGGTANGDVYLNVEALSGTGFADILGGDDRANRLDGHAGADRLEGRDGDDALVGGAGDDTLEGGAGADLLDGDEGSDTADYFLSGAAVAIDLAAGTATGGDAEGDTLVSIENLIGTDFDDALIGDGGANRLVGGRGDDRLEGGGGDDVLVGGRGADTIVGGAGIDIADYGLSLEGVVVDMASGASGGGDAAGDTFSGIEIVQGSFHDDAIRGDASDNILRGRIGADLLDGRAGFDIADYAIADEAVSVDLARGIGLAGEALGDTLVSIEMLIGSNWADTFVGSAGDDWFDGGFGDDAIAGGTGSDSYVLGFDSGADTVSENGDAADVDRVVIEPELAPKDVSVVRQGDDLLIELERDDGLLIDTMLVAGHFLGRETGIEEIVFDDGTVWDRDTIDALQRLGRFNAEDDIFRLGIEDEPARIEIADLIANDATEGVDDLELVSVQGFVDGVATIEADGSISFLGAKDHNGDAFFTYTVRDTFGRESTARVEVNLAPVNDAPVAADDPPFTGFEDTILRIPVHVLLANDSDVDGDPLTIVGLSALLDADGNPLHSSGGWPATNGRGNVSGGYIEFEPLPDHFGFAGFRYIVSDPSGATTTAAVELWIEPVNDAPRAFGDLGRVRLETTRMLTIEELLAQTFDIEDDAITFVGLVGDTNGTAVLDADAGTIAFTPEALGAASITFDVIDERGAEARLTLDLTAIPLNDPPRARDDSGFVTIEDTPLVIDPDTLLANDSDPNGDVLTITALQRFPDNGRVAFGADGSIVFTPRADYNGGAGFWYRVEDGRGGWDEAFVSITIIPDNDAPILRDDLAIGIEDEPLVILPGEAFGNDIEPDGDVIFFEDVRVVGVLTQAFTAAPVVIEALARDGGGLPDWLTFDSQTLTFSGTMPADLAAPVEIDVWFRYAEVGRTFKEQVSLDAEDAGALATGLRLDVDLPDYVVRTPTSAQHEFGADDLTDAVTVAATLADGTTLPAWLTFDTATLTFTGTPPESDPAEPPPAPLEVALTFTRTDPDTSVVTQFVDTVAIDPADAGALAEGVPYDSDVVLLELGEGSFAATLANGRPLPAWLAFDAETMRLVRTAIEPEPEAELARVQVIFTPTPTDLPDGTYASTERGFALEFLIDPAQPLDPAIETLLSNNAFFAAQGLFALDLSAATTIEAARESRADLPTWLAFDPESLTFEGTPPPVYVGAVPVRIDVTGDGAGLPSFSVITDVVVDETFSVAGFGGFSATTDGEYVFVDAPEDFNGAVVVSYTAGDEKGAVSEEPALIVLNVLPRPERPDALTDALTLPEDTAITISVLQLLANDRDDDGDPIRLLSISQPANGTVAVTLATVEIDPPAELPSLSEATYSATLADGAALPTWMTIDPATGRITAMPPLHVKTTLAILVSVANADESASATLEQSFDGNAGATLTYTPKPAYTGADGFTYTITDDAQGTAQGAVSVTVSPVNDPPDAFDDRLAGVEDTVLVIDPATLLANDTDVDDDPLTVLSVSNAVNGTVILENGAIIFTPTPNFDGEAYFDYVVDDGADGSDTGRVRVNVASTNRAPIAVADAFDGVEDTPLTIAIADLLANDSDPDLDAFTFVDVFGGDDGRAFVRPGGLIEFQPDENVTGTIVFTYTIGDGRRSDTGEIWITLAPVNDAPIANPDDGFVGEEDVPLVIEPAALIVNDRDVEGDAFTVVSVFDGDNGEVALVDGRIVFTPRADYFGNGGFSYVVEDTNGARGTGYASLSIRPGNDLPIAVSDAGFTMLEDGLIDLEPAVLMANDVDPDGDALVFLGVTGAELLDNGLWRVTPAADFFGEHVVTYRIADASGLGVATTVTIEVLPTPDDPVAGDDSYAMSEDTPLTILVSALLANDDDADLQALVFSRIIAAEGVSVAVDDAGRITVTPDADLAGPAHFVYEVVDSSGATAQARVTLSIAGVNDAPGIDPVPVLAGVEDGDFSITFNWAIFRDTEGDPLAPDIRAEGGGPLPDWLFFERGLLTLSGRPPQDFHGAVALEIAVSDGQAETVVPVTLTIAPVNDAPISAIPLADVALDEDGLLDAALPADAFTDVDGDALTLSAMLADDTPLPAWLAFDPAAGRFTGQPPADFNGTLDVRVVASDGALEVSDSFRIAIAPVDDAPVAADDVFDGGDQRIVTVPLALLLANDTDAEGDALSIVSVAGGPGFSVALDGAGNLVIDRDPALSGEIEIGYVVTDGALTDTGTLRVSLVPSNRAPEIAEIAALVTDEDADVALALPADVVVDADGDALTLGVTRTGGSTLPSWLSFDAATRTLTGRPPENVNGTISLTLTAFDGLVSTSRDFDLVIAPVNDLPVLSAPFSNRFATEDTAFSIALQTGLVSDVDGDTITYDVRRADGTALPSWLVFDPQAFTLSGTPPSDYSGTIALRMVISDGAATISDAFDLTIGAVNDAPVVGAPLADVAFAEDTPVSITIPADTFADVDGDPLALTATLADGAALPAWLAFDPVTGRFTGQPPRDANGALDMLVTASDGALSVSDGFRLEITPVADAPVVATPLPDVTIAEDTFVDISIPAGSFRDGDGDALTLAASLADGSALPAWLAFDPAAGRFTGQPPRDAYGALDIRVSASDGTNTIADTFRLAIAPVNDAPVATDDTVANVAAGQAITLTGAALMANDGDPDGDAVRIVDVQGTGNASVSLDVAGNVVYQAATGFVGQDTFVYTISDGDEVATATVLVEVVDPYAGWEQGGAGDDVLLGSLFRENAIFGGDGSDLLTGGFRNDQLAGGAGDDVLLGLGGNDVLSGGEDDDLLLGMAGADVLSGDAGDDLLIGGAGSDTFRFASGDGSDIILDFRETRSGRFFTIAGDAIEIDVEGIDTFEDLMATAEQAEGGVLFAFGGGDELFLSGTQLAALDRDSFSFY